MKVLLLGAQGQLGQAIAAAYHDAELFAPAHEGLDLRDAEAVHRCTLNEVRPELVINAAAYHNVPQCEANPEMAYAVNAAGARHLAVACAEAGARLVHISTDYVFGHGACRPLVESDPPAPLNVYGASKLEGERLIAAHHSNAVIVRTAALYGAAPCRAKGGLNFVERMLQLAAAQPEISVVNDEFTTPTWTQPLAAQVRLLAERAEPGLYHATCQGACSWHEFAKTIFEETGTEVRLLAASAKDFPSPVERPSYSVLDNQHARAQGLDIMPGWREALQGYLRGRNRG